MNIKKVLTCSCLFALAFVFINASFLGEKDALHKRNFNITIFEKREGQPAKKPSTDELSFKDGKLFSGYLKDKFSYGWLKYRINKDTIFIDSTDTEVRALIVEATTTDETNTTLTINLKVEDWDIEGTMKITKNDKLKRSFEFIGREKGGKPKKEKKKKGDEGKATMEPKPGEEVKPQ